MDEQENEEHNSPAVEKEEEGAYDLEPSLTAPIGWWSWLSVFFSVDHFDILKGANVRLCIECFF